MIRAHKIRLNPTPEQAVYFRKACGIARFTFNWGLGHIKDALSKGEKPATALALKKQFNAIKGELCPWIYEVSKTASETGFKNLSAALSNFYASKKGERGGKRVGFPKFKSKRNKHQSFYVANDRFKVNGHALVIQKLDAPVNMTECLRFTGKIMSGIISRYAGHWWISVTVELSDEVRPNGGEVIGMDVGIKTLATLSTGDVFENQKHYRHALCKLKRLHRAVSRKVKGSANRKKAAAKLALAYYRVTCLRQDTIHKMTTSLAKRAAIIGIEDLNIAGLIKNHSLAQAIGDAAWGEIYRQLGYKTPVYGGEVIKVGRFYKSSKIHNMCGCINDALTLNDREWICPGCGSLVLRDPNAALNIRDEATRILASRSVVATSSVMPVDVM